METGKEPKEGKVPETREGPKSKVFINSLIQPFRYLGGKLPGAGSQGLINSIRETRGGGNGPETREGPKSKVFINSLIQPFRYLGGKLPGAGSQGLINSIRNPVGKPEDSHRLESSKNVEISPIESSKNVEISPIESREVMVVRLVILIPTVIRLYAKITLEVQISLQPNTPRPIGTGEVKLSIFSPGFRLLSARVRHVSFSLTKEQSIERFEMEAQEEGIHKIIVLVFDGGTLVGSRTIESQVAANVETEPARSVDSNIKTGTAKEGEVTLQVLYDRAQEVYSYELYSATFEVDRALSKPLLRPPEEIIDVFVNRLNYRARNLDSSSSPAIATWRLRSIGIRLWRDFIPEELAQQFWEHRSEIEILTILSDVVGHMIPWEAMYPIPRIRDKAGFLIEQVTVIRKPYYPSPSSTEPFHFSETCFVVPEEDDPPRAKQEVEAIESILSGKKREVGNLSDLRKVLDERKFNLLHLACHNLMGGNNYQGPYILLGKDHFEPDLLGDFIGKQEQSSLIFMNVCRSDGGSPRYTSIINWADSFLQTGAGAFIGTLWEVRDDTAALFAVCFYLELVSGKPLGEAMKLARNAISGKPDADKLLGEAMKLLRNTISGKPDADDPTWLAYTLYGDPETTLSGKSTPSMHSAQSEN